MTTTLSPDTVGEIAAAHERARREVAPLRRITLNHPDMTLDDAYACQQAWVELQTAAGARIVGHKIGLTSRAMQQAMRIDEPDFGVLLDDMVIPNGGSFAAATLLDPKLEVEVAFVLGEDLSGADVATEDVLSATARIVPALELIDARSHRVDPIDGQPRTVRDTIADNAADAGVILGDAEIPADHEALRWASAVMHRNEVVEETGVAAGVLGDPTLGVAWLARRLHGYGVTLAAGEIVLAGSFTRPVDCRAGDRFAVEFGPYGTITVSVT